MNLEEIAKLSGVSRSTVSRVINNDRNVRDTTRQRVWEIVRRMNYQPNAAARGLAVGRTHVLGLVIPTGVAALFSDPYFPILIQGVSSACNLHDRSVMLWLAEPEYERRTIRQVIHGGLIDGVIVSSMLVHDPVVEALIDSDKPFVLIGRHPSSISVNYIDSDNRNGACEIVTHLLRLGRRQVATITGPQNMIVGVDRRDGYLNALRERGLAIDPNLIVESDFTETGGFAAMQQLLPYQPQAVFAASDAMAMGALRAIRETGLRVPDDIAIAGFDDMPFAARSEPPLTTVRQPILRMGAVAAETLIDLIEHPESKPRRIILPIELVVRTSCGSALS
ncbi:MAG TPA: LacI family DNA-binding transcriptional regulator [Anaerolineae bacterium]|nr:LacI family DNA-binding transcriptional regulator [Anaerolineae bacterium]